MDLNSLKIKSFPEQKKIWLPIDNNQAFDYRPVNTKKRELFFLGENWYKTPIGNNVFEYYGCLPKAKNAINFAFFVHPMNKWDFRFLVSDINTIKTMENLIAREEKRIEKLDELQEKENKKAEEENRPPRQFKKPNLVNSFYNCMGNKVIGYVRIEIGNKICHGYLILIPFLPNQYIEASNNKILKQKIISSLKNSCDIARELNCEYIGLGAHNSITSQTKTGNELTKYTDIPITSGNGLTALGIIEGIKLTIKSLDISITDSIIGIVGASGSVGRLASTKIAEYGFKKTILCARKAKKLEDTFKGIVNDKRLELNTNLQETIKQSDILVFAVSSTKSQLQYHNSWFKKGAIICDASRPLVIDNHLMSVRPDLYVFEGAIFKIPSCSIDGSEFLRMGKGLAYGCLASTSVYALNREIRSRGNGILIDKKDAEKTLQEAYNLGIRPVGIKFENKKIVF